MLKTEPKAGAASPSGAAGPGLGKGPALPFVQYLLGVALDQSVGMENGAHWGLAPRSVPWCARSPPGWGAGQAPPLLPCRVPSPAHLYRPRLPAPGARADSVKVWDGGLRGSAGEQRESSEFVGDVG